MRDSDLRRISTWMSERGIERAEISCDGARYRLVVDVDGRPAEAAATSDPLPGKTVRNRYPGKFLSTHPERAKPEAFVGETISPNEIVGFCSSGHLLLPILSDISGSIAEVLTADHATIGFGTPILRLD